MIRVATYNVGDGHDQAKVRDFLIISQNADAIGLQEASDRGGAINDFVAATGYQWRAWYGDGRSGAQAVPILYRRSLGRVTGMYSVTAVGQTPIGNPGAGPGKAKPKVVNRVRLWAPGYGLVHFMNSHMIPSVQRSNLSNAGERSHHFLHHAEAVARIVRHRLGLVFYTADDNAPDDFSLLHPLRAAGLVQDVDVDTHGHRGIDHVWHRQSRLPFRHRLVVLDRTVLRGLSSDHDCPIITYK